MKKKILFGIVFMSMSVMACKEDSSATKSESKPTELSASIGDKPMTDKAAAPTSLQIEELKAGTGATAVSGKNVQVHYTGWLTNGTKFDSSVDRKEAFEFPLGQGRVIKGWDQGVEGMKEGGKRKLTIPPTLGYGDRDMGVIPPNSVLVFEVELLKVK